MIESGWYMASTFSIAPKFDLTLGAILTTSKNNNHGIPSRLERKIPWCLDNGIFTDKFSAGAWIDKLSSLKKHIDTCLFVAIPDVIGDCAETLKQFSHYRSMVSDFPVALVSQDGIKEQAHLIPWDDFDCLFIGGSDEHKLGKEGGWILNEVKKRGKWVHVGRVNSISRILQFWQADSWDGTHLGFMPSDVSKFHAAVLQVRNMKKTKRMF